MQNKRLKLTKNKLPQAFTSPALRHAWENLAMRKCSPGVDGMKVDNFARGVDSHLAQLCRELAERSYKPQAVATFPLAKKSGGFREICLLTLRDKIVAKSMASYLNRDFDNRLSPHAFAYRPHKGALKAVAMAEKAARKYPYALKADIAKFFASIDHDLLKQKLSFLTGSEIFVETCLQMMDAPYFDGITTESRHKGLPEGSPLAPVLSNIYMDMVDRVLEKESAGFIRYADDYLLFYENADQASAGLRLLNEQLGQLKLSLSPNKSRIHKVEEGVPFLGFIFNATGKTPTNESKVRLKNKLSQQPYADEDKEEYLNRRQSIIRGWKNYFEAESPVQSEDISQHTREDLKLQLKDADKEGRDQQVIYGLCRLLAEESEIDPEDQKAHSLKLAEKYEAKGLFGAANRCRAQADTNSEELPQEKLPEPVFGSADVELWQEIFNPVGLPIFTQRLDSVGRHSFRPYRRELSGELLLDHWQGKSTLATQVYDSSNKVRFALLDLDIKKKYLEQSSKDQLDGLRENMLDYARILLARARDVGLYCLLEDSGYKGYHIWFFFSNRIPAAKARKLLHCLVEGIEPPVFCHTEFFPSSREKPESAIGSIIKIPLGRHLLTNRYSAFLSPDGQELPLPIRTLSKALFNKGKQINQAFDLLQVKKPQEISPGSSILPPNENQLTEDNSQLTKLYNGCNILEALSNKAQKSGHLTHFERVIIRSTLMPIGQEGFNHAVDIISHCRDFDPRITKRMLSASTGKKPISCAKIREILGDFTVGLGCDCRFKPKKREYAHPLRHLQREATLAKPQETPTSLPIAKEDMPQRELPKANEGYDMLKLLEEYHLARKRTLELQTSIAERLNSDGHLQLPCGKLMLEGPDDQLRSVVIRI